MNRATRLALTLLAAAAAAGSCGGAPSRSGAAGLAATPTHTMTIQDPVGTERSIPPIDAAAPAVYRTATFALG